MCGIFGLLGHITETKSPAEIFTSFQNLRGRGPDRSLVVYNPKCFLGFHRLAIMGLDIDGDQPFHIIDGDQTHYLLCNGEIYNFRVLIDKYQLNVSKTGSDCAVILPLLKLFAYDFVKLNREMIGEYSFAVVTFQNNKLVQARVCTDPLSVRPLFFAFTDDFESMGFSSLLSGLSNLFTEVKRFTQKSILTWVPGHKPVFETYWDNVKSPAGNKSQTPTAHDYRKVVSIVEAAVARRLVSDRPVGCLLSGGLDSSLVCAIAAKKLSEDYPGKNLPHSVSG